MFYLDTNILTIVFTEILIFFCIIEFNIATSGHSIFTVWLLEMLQRSIMSFFILRFLITLK